jgi:hypothetical protein
MGKWTWIWHGSERLRSVGILPDATLWNPNNYPEDIVRAAIAAAEAQRHERRSKAAKKAAVTRQRRQERKVLEIAKRSLAEHEYCFPNRTNCEICGRGLGDPQSIQRGVGSECWQDVLRMIQRLRAAHAAA